MIYMREETAPGTCAGVEDRQDNIAVPPKRRKQKRLIPGIPNYSRTATPKQVLKAAEAMTDEEAREYMLRHFRYHGWGEVAIHAITTDPYIFLSIARYQNLASELRAFDFSQMEMIVTATHFIRSRAWEGNMRAVIDDLRVLLRKWEQPSDRLKVLAAIELILWGVLVTQVETARVQVTAN